MITRWELLQYISHQLCEYLPVEERVPVQRLIAEHIFQMPYEKLYTEAHQMPIADTEKQATELILSELQIGKPIQYILGEAYFYNRPFRVSPATLIPRPETEELCFWILSHLPKSNDSLSGLDIATGSGCIAITLAIEAPRLHMEALDISPEALEIARENAHRYHVEIPFIQHDFYSWSETNPTPRPTYDLIVANPPYIPKSETPTLPRRVYDYEPHLALFVTDDAPTRPYQRIATLAQALLKKNGILACEVHENYADRVATDWEKAGLHTIRIHKDFHGKKRIATAQHP